MNTLLNLGPLQLSADTLRSLAWTVGLLLTDYVCVVVAVAIDLFSATRRARLERRRRTSSGYRRSVEKLTRYVAMLLALSAVDGMIVIAAMMLRSTVGWAVAPLPLFTTLGAICICLIEAKSVAENTQKGSDYASTARALTDLLSDKDLRNLIDAIRRLQHPDE